MELEPLPHSNNKVLLQLKVLMKVVFSKMPWHQEPYLTYLGNIKPCNTLRSIPKRLCFGWIGKRSAPWEKHIINLSGENDTRVAHELAIDISEYLAGDS